MSDLSIAAAFACFYAISEWIVHQGEKSRRQ